MPDAIGDAKRELRRRMRSVRGAVDDVAARTERIWQHVEDQPEVIAARVLMAYSALPGEPDAEEFIERCRARGTVVIVPPAEPTAPPPVDAGRIDVVVVPGLAFTRAGARLGQGGGWYDRVLGPIRGDCLVVGVCFTAQIVDKLPTEPHDRGVDVVVTEDGSARQ